LVLSGCTQEEKEVVKENVPVNTGITQISEKKELNVQ
jgi:hypothetical protein